MISRSLTLLFLTLSFLSTAQESSQCLTQYKAYTPHALYQDFVSSRMAPKTIKVHITVDNDVFVHFGNNLADTRSYVNYLFRNAQRIFQVEGIDLHLSSVYIWTQKDPFNLLNGDVTLETRYLPYISNNFSGDVSILLSDNLQSSIAGTIAGLCNPRNVAVCGLLFNSTAEFPTYSNDVQNLSHEIGHLLGSSHTFECEWLINGTFQAIDGCGATLFPNFCTQPTTPLYVPSIMGYCQNYSFLNGFGPLPTQRMKDHISQSPCVKETAFYQTTLLDSAIIWTECRPGVLPDQSDYKAVARGIVYGNPTSRFKAKVVRFGNPSVVLDSLVNLQYNVQQDLGTWFNKTDSIVSLILIDQTLPNYEYKEKIYVSPNTCVYASPDLALTAATTTPTPAQYANYSVTYTLTNQSAVASQNIQVEIPAVVGAVYLGGNVYQASAGVFDGIKTWIIPAVAAGQSVTLTLNYFNLTTTAKKYFAQVSAMSGTDLDSSPGNNNTGIPSEDDEVSITINGGVNPPACSISATVTGIACSNNGTPNIASDDTYTYQLNVSGTNTSSSGWSATINGQAVTGSYNSPKSVNGGLISGGAVSYQVGDIQITSCTTQVSVTPPAPCSTVQPPIGPCPSKSDFPWHEWIAGVAAGTLNNLSTKSAYTNYPSPVTDLTTGSHAVSLTTEFSYFAYDEYWKIWLDLNSDGALDDATETVYQGKLNQPANGNAKHTLAGSLVIPAGTPVGTRLMRVSMKRGAYALPCESLPFGEVEDYQVRVVSGTNPTCSITAQVSGVACNNNGTASNPADDTFGFSLMVSGTNTGAQGWTSTIANQTISGSYGVAKPLAGYAISGGNLSFTVRDAQQNTCTAQASVTAPATCSGGGPVACASSSAFPWHEWISRVKVGNLDFASGKSNFSDFSSATVLAARGQSLVVGLTSSFSWFTADQYYRVWIDYNNDGAFDPATEQAYSGILSAPPDGTASKVLNGSITIPTMAAVAKVKMRVSMKRGAYPTVCEVLPFGEVEEYSVQIAAQAVLQNSIGEARSTEPVEIEDVLVYPNPASGAVHIRWKDDAPATVTLMSASGVVVAQTALVTQAEFDVSALHGGLYFVRVEAQGRRAVVRKMVVAGL
jgi:GEVED domain/Metallo-peptidase family M12/Secretion system C-terminal sorting domain/Domain of unknown function DUF11